jgi:hypothetical protein
MGKYSNRPRPILAAILSGSWRPAVGTAVTAAVAFGLLDSTQASAVNNVAAGLVTLLTALTATLHAFGVLTTSEKQTTPLADPVDADGERLVRNTTVVQQVRGEHAATEILPLTEEEGTE